jgi:hypothetical protein
MSDNKEIPMPKAETEEVVNLTVTDIAYCKQIIEIASKNGAFEAKELAIVGVTYNRISKWLEDNKPTDAVETSTDQGETK